MVTFLNLVEMSKSIIAPSQNHLQKEIKKLFLRFPLKIHAFLKETQGRSHCGGQDGHVPRPPPPPTSISKPNKVHLFQFQTSGILLLTKIIRTRNFTIFTVYANIYRVFLNYLWLGEIYHFTLDLLKSSDI